MKEIATPVKGISWTDLIVDIDIGKTKHFPVEKESTIRPLISGRVRDKYPDREYTATKNGNVLKVKRVK